MAKGKNYGGFGGGMPNMQNMMRQAQKMIEEQQKLQEELKDKRFEASSGGGMVNAVVDGEGKLIDLTIKPECVDPEDVEMLQDLIVTAVSEAIGKAKAEEDERVNSLTGGLNIPGLKF
ncbi:MAG: YbaB/EbfC family nucleoid-associated protein [Armatimonadetes bacterium]|nr:YbaB/EbfC family nucleoid-associated protein [Candidatus Hippobium faecium]